MAGKNRRDRNEDPADFCFNVHEICEERQCTFSSLDLFNFRSENQYA